MSIKVCVDENMISTVAGVGMRRNWFLRPVAEAYLKSTKDGEISRAPDPVTMIDGDVPWYNNSGAAQNVWVQVIRAPRDLVAQSPSTVEIHDAWSFATGKSPSADFPSVTQNSFGGSAQIDRQEVAADKIKYGRLFLDGDASQTFVEIGVLEPKESMHFRYQAAVQTPGTWTTPSEFEPSWEARAYWARLIVLASPVGSA